MKCGNIRELCNQTAFVYFSSNIFIYLIFYYYELLNAMRSITPLCFCHCSFFGQQVGFGLTSLPTMPRQRIDHRFVLVMLVVAIEALRLRSGKPYYTDFLQP